MKVHEDIDRSQVVAGQDAKLFAVTAATAADVAKELEGTSVQKGRLIFQLPAVQSDKASFSQFCFCRCAGVCVCTAPGTLC